MTINVYTTNYSGTWWASLPEAKVSHVTDVLSDVPSASFSIPQVSPGASDIGGWDREIQIREIIEDEGVNEIVFQGPVVSESGDENECTFECEGVLSHLGTRIIDRTTLLYTSIEQRAIGMALIDYAQDAGTPAQANRDLNISGATFTGTTRIRSRKYEREEHANILDLLKEFPTLDDGFEFDIVITPDGGRFWTPYYPKKGTTLTGIKLQYVEGDGELSSKYRRDYKRQITQAYVTGGPNGLIKFEQNFEDLDASGVYGLRQEVISDGSQSDLPWLLDKGKREVSLRKKPIFVPDITLPRYPKDYRRLIQTGDYVPLNIKRGRVNITEPRRVLQKKWNVEADTVELTLAEVA